MKTKGSQIVLKRWFLMCALCFLGLAPSQAAAQDTQLWTSLFANGPVKDDGRFLLWFDGHARFSDDVSQLGVSIIRPGLGYRVNKRLSLWAGYAHVIARPNRDIAPDADNVVDNRIWQQATYSLTGGDGPFRLSGRTRLEQRFLNTGDETGYRLRQFFRLTRPFEESRWSATAWNEVFIALNDTDFGARAGYDQNRTFVGMNYKANARVRLEGGYLFNHIRREAAPDAFNHNVSVSISTSF